MTTKPTPDPEPVGRPHRDARTGETSGGLTARAPVQRDASLPPPPVLTTLLPSSAAIGDPSFGLRVVGSGFTPTSVIVFAGHEEPTTFLTAEELTTGVNMDVWHGPDPAISVLVRTPGEAGVVDTDPLLFAFTEPRAVPLDEAHASKPIPLMNLITPM